MRCLSAQDADLITCRVDLGSHLGGACPIAESAKMKLEKLEIENFRCFERITLELHPELTVLIAPNGAGKTALLDCARIALWPYVKAFDLGSQTGKSATIQIEDVRLTLIKATGSMEPCLPSAITATGQWEAGTARQTWRQERKSVKSGTNTLTDSKTKALTAFGEGLQARVRTAAEQNKPGKANMTLPMVAYLGTGRLWYQGRYSSVASDVTLDKRTFSRLSGYLNCLTVSSSFKQFSDWYGWVCRGYFSAQLKAQKNRGGKLSDMGLVLENAQKVVKTVVDCLIKQQTGWHDLDYSEEYHQQLVLTNKQGHVLPLELLSDGLRNTIFMVAELAFRVCKLNPHLGANAAKETHGIALIDEVDMFLHPAWQQTILASLREAFPRIQFIVTTHSPQVLSAIHRENIRIISTTRNGATVAEPPLATTYGEESGHVLHGVMGVDQLPPIPERADLSRLTALYDQGKYKTEEAQKLLKSLTKKLGTLHPQLQYLQRSRERQEFMKKVKFE